jgi:hypothetical protein
MDYGGSCSYLIKIIVSKEIKAEIGEIAKRVKNERGRN